MRRRRPWLAHLSRGKALMAQARYRSAARVLTQAVAASRRARGLDTLATANALTALAACYQSLAKYSQAGPLLQRALTIVERLFGREGSEVAAVYHELAALEHAAGNWARGVPFARIALRIRRRALGARDPLVAGDMVTLAALLDRQRKFKEAEGLYTRAIGILERAAGPAHPDVAVALNNLAAIQHARGRLTRAEGLYLRALDLHTARFGPRHPQVAFCASNLAALLTASGRAQDAAELLRSALPVFRSAFGPRSPNVGRCLEHYADALRALGRRREAQACARRAERILGNIESVNDEGVAATATINPQLARFRLIVGPSPINRLGVFADEAIPPGRRIIEYTGERIGRREAKRRSDLGAGYLVVMKGYYLDGAIGGSGAEYVNHSCAPNLRERRLRGRVHLFSLRSIARGEELTVDYRYSPDIEPVACRCGAPTCRGTINAARRPRPRRGLRRQAVLTRR
ncbi:MAG TPA: tetratricopeptide repeat protein [Vicinamibacterales bacterium]|nr:tetratricopeptide repeat protein [Vicinamibacterales bacterium]